jgi:hypothetical protein
VDPDRRDDVEVVEPADVNPADTDPADSDLLRDELKGQTVRHAVPARLEDEGQSGG